MTLIKVLPAFTKAPGVPARTGDTIHSAKRESGNILKTGHQSREKEGAGKRWVRAKE